MQNIKIGNSEIVTSTIAYGCMAMGGSWDELPLTQTDIKKGIRIVNTAIENGVSFFDHADIYANGKSELLFGEVLKQNRDIRDRIVIQSKCGIRFKGVPDIENPARYDFSYDHIINSVNGTLNRLGIEQLDILLLHRPDPLMQPEEVAKAFEELKQLGKVRHFGVSNFNIGQIELLKRDLNQPLLVNQIEMSLLHHHAINDGILCNQIVNEYGSNSGLLDYCRINNISIQAWSPFALGKIFNRNSDIEKIRKLAELIDKYSKNKNVSNEAIALSWLLKHPAGIQPIIGTTNNDRIVNSCQASKTLLSREEWYNLFTVARGKSVP